MIRDIKILDSVAHITLTQGYTALIDADDVPLVSGHNWYALINKRPDQSILSVYAVRNQTSPDGKRRLLYLHRFLTSASPHFEVDHRDSNGLNNRRSNLRVATKAQNRRNARTRIDNTSGFKGVYWNRTGQKWGAYIKLDGKRRTLGWFDTPEAAADAYAKASAELHGQFGRTS